MGLELTNSLSENQRESYKAQFAHSGLHQEMTRLQVAVRTVQDEEGTVGHLFTDTNQHKFAEVSICCRCRKRGSCSQWNAPTLLLLSAISFALSVQLLMILASSPAFDAFPLDVVLEFFSLNTAIFSNELIQGSLAYAALLMRRILY